MSAVVHWKKDEYDVYIGRGNKVAGGTPEGISDKHSMENTPVGERGWLGNPYTKEEYGREQCIERFKADFYERLESDEEFRTAVEELRGKALGCWCAPEACHGEVIAEYIERYGNVPDKIREYDQWICWRYEEGDKEPVIAENPKWHASTTDPKTWCSFERARECDRHSEYTDGIGFVFTEEDPFFGIDCDNVYDDRTGEWEEWALDAIEQVDSYTEFSPSITGTHTLGIGEKPGDRCKTGMEQTLGRFDKSDIEIYDRERYFTVTGDRLEDSPERVRERPDALSTIYTEAFESVDDSTAEEIAEGIESIEDVKNAKTSTDGSADLSDDEVIELASNASNGDGFGALWDGSTARYPSHSEARMALLCHLAFWTGRDPHQMDRLYQRSGLHSGGHVEKWNRLSDEEIEKARGVVSDTYSGSSSGDSGREAYMSARTDLTKEIDELGPLDAVEVENEATAFGESHAEYLTAEQSEISATAGILSSVYRPFGKGDFEELIEKGVRSAGVSTEDGLATPVDEFLKTELDKLTKLKTRDHVQGAKLRFKFENGYVETSAVGKGQTHNNSRDLRANINSAIDAKPGKPSKHLRDPSDWWEWIQDFIEHESEIEWRDGPRTRAFKALKRAIKRGVAYTEDPGYATAGEGYSDRGSVYAPEGEDSEYILVPTDTIRHACDEQEIGRNALQSELAARGHTVGEDNSVSVVKRTDSGPRRFWKLNAGIEAPKEYRESRRDPGEEVIEEQFDEAPGHSEVATDGGEE